MIMAHSSPMDETQISGLSSKTAAEIVDLVRTEIRAEIVDLVRAEIDASRTKAGETHPQPQEAIGRPKFAASGQIWTAVGTTIATVALIVGIFQWQLTDFREEMRADSRSIRAEIGNVWAEFGNVRTEIGSLREEVFAIRGEVAALGERVARVETLLADRLPTAP